VPTRFTSIRTERAACRRQPTLGSNHLWRGWGAESTRASDLGRKRGTLQPVRLRLSGRKRVHATDKLMTRPPAERLDCVG
jgi:hypothetical protein